MIDDVKKKKINKKSYYEFILKNTHSVEITHKPSS